MHVTSLPMDWIMANSLPIERRAIWIEEAMKGVRNEAIAATKSTTPLFTVECGDFHHVRVMGPHEAPAAAPG